MGRRGRLKAKTDSQQDKTPLPGILLLAHAPLASAYARAASDLGFATPCLMAFDMPTGMTLEAAFGAAKSMVAYVPAAASCWWTSGEGLAAGGGRDAARQLRRALAHWHGP